MELDYTGKLKEDFMIFDTTDEKTAQKAGIKGKGTTYRPVVICVGEGHVLPGLDKHIIGKELGKEYHVDLGPEEGFGKKNAKLIQLIASHKFTKAGIVPQQGLQVNIDNQYGIIRNVTGGRVIVDFNNPLSGKDLIYSFTIRKIITDAMEKVKAVMSMELHMDDAEIVVDGNHAMISLPVEIPKEFSGKLEERICKLTGLEKITFKKKDEEKPTPNHLHHKDEKKADKIDEKKKNV